MDKCELTPMSDKELKEFLETDNTSKKEDILAAYKLGNAKIIINGSLIPKDEAEYKRNLNSLERTLEGFYPNTKITITKRE